MRVFCKNRLSRFGVKGEYNKRLVGKRKENPRNFGRSLSVRPGFAVFHVGCTVFGATVVLAKEHDDGDQMSKL